MEYFIINSKIKNNNEDEKIVKSFNGEEYYVFETTMIVEGVLNGLLYPKEENEKFVSAWNGRPTTKNHPELNGEQVSANSPTILENTQLGLLFNTKYEHPELKSETWIKVDKYDDEIENTTEVSTGLFVEVEKTSGTFNGVDYTGIARNYRPDHLALLTDTIGACSNENGCKIKTNDRESKNMAENIITTGSKFTCNEGEDCEEKIKKNEAEKSGLISKLSKLFSLNRKEEIKVNELSFDNIWNLAYEAIKSKYKTEQNYVGIQDIFSGELVYYIESEINGSWAYKFYKTSYTISEKETVIILGDSNTEVMPKMTYEEITPMLNNEDEKTTTGGNMPESEVKVNSDAPVGKLYTDADIAQLIQSNSEKAAIAAVEAYKQNAKTEVEEIKKVELVESISANSKNYVGKEILSKLSLNDLEEMSVKLSEIPEDKKADFSANGAETINSNKDSNTYIPKSIGDAIRSNRKGGK